MKILREIKQVFQVSKCSCHIAETTRSRYRILTKSICFRFQLTSIQILALSLASYEALNNYGTSLRLNFPTYNIGIMFIGLWQLLRQINHMKCLQNTWNIISTQGLGTNSKIACICSATSLASCFQNSCPRGLSPKEQQREAFGDSQPLGPAQEGSTQLLF